GTRASQYDPAGRLTRRTYAATGQQAVGVDFGYDRDGLPTSQSNYEGLGTDQPAGTLTLSNDAFGRESARSYAGSDGGLGVPVETLWYAFDAAGQVRHETRQAHRTPTDPAVGYWDNEVFSYDFDLGYDGGGQLTQFGGSGLDYDSYGNRTSGGQTMGK